MEAEGEGGGVEVGVEVEEEEEEEEEGEEEEGEEEEREEAEEGTRRRSVASSSFLPSSSLHLSLSTSKVFSMELAYHDTNKHIDIYITHS